VSGFGADRLSRTGRSSTGLEVLHSSHQCRWELSSRFRVPQLSQTKTSFLTRKKCYVGQPPLPSVVFTGGEKPNLPGHKKGLASGIPVSTMRLESVSFYEHDDCTETLPRCPSHSLRLGPVRLRREPGHTMSITGLRRVFSADFERSNPVARTSSMHEGRPPQRHDNLPALPRLRRPYSARRRRCRSLRQAGQRDSSGTRLTFAC